MNHQLSAMRHDPCVIRQASPALRYALCAIVLFSSIASIYALYPRFISQVYYLKASQYQKDGYLGLAIRYFKKAISYQPQDTIILSKLADTFFNLGMKEKPANEAFVDILKAKNAYLQATQHNPMDAETAYGLTRVESQLEQLFDILHPNKKNNPYHPLPYFDRALHLRPNSITYRYALARYLFQHDDKEALYQQVYDLVRIYPPAYKYLKKEPMWSSKVKEIVKSALMDAIKQDMFAETSHKMLSALLIEDKDWPNAIVHYKKALGFKNNRILERDYINIGILYLKNNQPKDAETSFIEGMYRSPSIDSTFSNISRIYKDANRFDEYTSFYQDANERFIFSPKMHIISARYLIDLKQYRRAQRILTDLNRESPTAEAYYWLARIAETKKDFDEMELNIQKATVIEPSNTRYRKIFYGLLKRLGKYETAEREIGLMIRNSENPSPQFFDERAKLRRNLKNYTGAVEDWKSSIRLAPKNAVFHANIAEAYMKLGNLSQALDYYQKAVQLDPGNQGYAGKYKKLKGDSS